MKSIYTLLYTGLCCGTLLLGSCNDCTTTVTPFENEDGSWTVYSTGDTLLMEDKVEDKPDTVYTFVNTRTNSEPVPGEGFDVTDACIEQYDTRRTSVMQETSSPKKRLPALSVIAQRRPNDIQVTLAVGNRASLPIPDINTPQYTSLVINGITYTDVFKVVNPDSTTTGVSRIFFNREFGFLRVVYFNDTVLKNKVLERTSE